MTEKKIVVVMLAGGKGSRMNVENPKQFLRINDKPLWYFSFVPFLEVFPKAKFIWVMPKDYLKNFKQDFLGFFPEFNEEQVTFIEGGATRFHSSLNAITKINSPALVFIHDVARCLIEKSLIQKLFDHASKYQSAVPYVSVRDTIRLKENNSTSTMLDRRQLMQVQTPQVFDAEILKKSFDKIAFNANLTDDASVVEAAGFPLQWVEGSHQNLKTTFAEDLDWVKWKLNQPN